MHSPKFPKKAADIRATVDATQLRKLWIASVRDRIKRHPLPDPVEFLDFHVQSKQRCREIENSVVAGEYVPERVIRITSEKSKGLCRQIVLPSPSDALILQALSNVLWSTIRPKSPSKTAFYAQKDQPFSKRNKKRSTGDEFGYGPLDAWLDFQAEVLGFSKNHAFIVVTDIANYYDSIIHGFLRAILAEYALEKEHVLDLLLYVLDSMLWRPDYMPNYGIGLPQMDLDAPRLLAHTNLFEIDGLFSSDNSISFARFMDDMDFGVDNIAKAKQVLRDLDLSLQTRNIRLNSGKTKILTAFEAHKHFRINDNERFERIKLLISGDKISFRNKNMLLSRLLATMQAGLGVGYFDAGNGDKVLKRIILLLTSYKICIDQASFVVIFYNKPQLRDSLIDNWSKNGFTADQIRACAVFLRSGESIDDASKLSICVSIVNSQYISAIPFADIDFLIDSYNKRDHIGLYCRIWLLSRFADDHLLNKEIDNTSVTWTRHRHLARLVAGLYGLFKSSLHFGSYEAYVRKWGGLEATGILDFHEGVSSTAGGYQSISSFLKAQNTGFPNKITHAKTLLLASLLMNKTMTKLERTKLLGSSTFMMKDIYYREIFSKIITMVV